MRSVLKYFRPYAGDFHLLTSDFLIPKTEPNSTISPDFRLGQVPQWLNQRKRDWLDDRIKLSITHHADIFDPYNDTIFNSYAIESQFGHLQGVSENFVYMNDDFFFLGPVTQRTFYTSAYGLVLRMQSDLLVAPTQYKSNVRGEWRSLAASNVLLSGRFGVRHRPYVSHEAKASSLSLLHEISQVWSSQIATVATHPFRETKSGESDISMMFMMVHFVVERWREALLWTWVVGKHGGLDDSWGEEEIGRAWADLGGAPDRAYKLTVKAGRRDTMNTERVSTNLRASGLKQVDQTRYMYSSQDGYPYTGFVTSIKNQWPKFGGEVPENKLLQCGIDPVDCFADDEGSAFTRASDVFTNIAFRKPKCGDCVITALVKASGETGLDAFLPPVTRTLPSLAGKIAASNASDVPHLPLVDRWEDGQFALREVMHDSRDMNIRSWALRLLQRYRFVIGETPSYFAMLTSPTDAVSMTRRLKAQADTVLLCVNDDVARDDEKVSKILQDWFKEHWPQPAAWEV